MENIKDVQEIIQLSRDLPSEHRPKFLKQKFEQTISDLNEFIKYLESENIETRITIYSNGNENEFPYKVENISARLLASL